ncbi:hypothetical protein [Streptomyces sp. NPDC090053]|uniref:hypothetical protein n=1 Tax=Streptomyces sp. NPDC090053 TaxID=3365932 RepID=UPI003804207E
MISHTHVPRLLPWTGPAGKPAYLLGGGAGRISRIADTIERDQLGMADDLLDDAAEALADRTATRDQLRSMLGLMTQSLTDVHRIAESRGARLPAPAYEDHASWNN